MYSGEVDRQSRLVGQVGKVSRYLRVGSEKQKRIRSDTTSRERDGTEQIRWCRTSLNDRRRPMVNATTMTGVVVMGRIAQEEYR